MPALKLEPATLSGQALPALSVVAPAFNELD